MPSLHIMGTADPLLSRSNALLRYYDSNHAQVLQHGEGHNIPSMRTGLYPSIKEWIDAQYRDVENER